MRVIRDTATQSVLFHFDSPADYADTVRESCPRGTGRGSWGGGESWAMSLERAKRGNIDLVPQAERLVDKIAVEAQRESHVWTSDIAGAFPMVPDFLSGRPECMRRRIIETNERAPIKIYVELTSSGAVEAADLVKRGTAILALALLLNTERAIELHVIVGLDAHAADMRASFAVIPLGSSPLDIALSCNALTSVGFCRNMGYQFLMARDESRAGGGWAWHIHPEGNNRDRYVRKLRQALGATPKDIIIPPAHCYDPIVQDPIGFVKRSLAEALEIENEE